MGNLDLWEKVRSVPKEAQKEIKGGRLKGMTDINPLWRQKKLTEQFGMCGIGWKYEITKQWLENGANGEIAAFVNINLFVKVEGEWSEAIPGTGGSAFVSNETRGLYTSDECFKMALTDAISVSCKALGFGADIYWQGDKSKYDKPELGKSNQSEGGEVKQLPNDEVLMFKNFQKELGETDQKFLTRLTNTIQALASKHQFQFFQVKSLHDLAKLDQVIRDEIVAGYRLKIEQAKGMIQEGQGQEDTCGCGKKISEAELAYCKKMNIKPACRNCQRKAG